MSSRPEPEKRSSDAHTAKRLEGELMIEDACMKVVPCPCVRWTLIPRLARQYEALAR